MKFTFHLINWTFTLKKRINCKKAPIARLTAYFYIKTQKDFKLFALKIEFFKPSIALIGGFFLRYFSCCLLQSVSLNGKKRSDSLLFLISLKKFVDIGLFLEKNGF